MAGSLGDSNSSASEIVFCKNIFTLRNSLSLFYFTNITKIRRNTLDLLELYHEQIIYLNEVFSIFSPAVLE